MRLLDRVRLLTLIGPGGCGKTRLAIETLAGVDAGPRRHLVRRARRPRPTASLVAQATALAVGVPIPAQRSAQEALAAHLAGREAIVVLDNCEHVIDACARLAEDLLRAGPGVRVVATSREPLHCEGEVAWRVPSLAEAGRLFARARSRRPGASAPPTTTEATIDEICRRLDGMPLAIELAAARVSALSLDQIAARLGDSLDVLAAGSRTARTRQQTLRATIEWSHDLLTGEERVLFRRLGVFAGGFTLEAAEDVCAGGAIARRRIVDLVARLVDKSLVSRDRAALPPARHHPPVRRRAPRRVRRARDGRRAPPRLVPGPGRGARPAVRRPAPLAAHAGDRARQPALGPDLRAAPRPAGRPAPGHVAVALLAGPRLLRRGRPLAGGDADRRARAHRAAGGGPAGERRALAAQRRLHVVPAARPGGGRRLPRAGRRARDRRGPLPARDARAVGQQHRPGRRISSPTRSPWPAASATGACWRPPPTRRP